MTSETDAEFVERMAQELDYGLASFNDRRLFALARRGAADAPKGFTAGWLAGRADAAKVAEELGDKWFVVWRKGLKADSHLESMSDGADEVAAAIRELPPPPAGETSDE
jgi:phage protein D